MSPVTDRELASWRAYLETGSLKEAAHQLGIHKITVAKHIATLRKAHGVRTNAQLAAALERTEVA